MPMKRRKESITGFYHVIVKGINKEKIFNQNREKTYLKKIILKHLDKYIVELYCYCIMSNHAHFIIRAEIQVLSAFMAAILAEYAMYYNYKHNRNGHVFQNRFRSECIESEKYLLNCMRYIHRNPVKAKIVKKPERYKYSSMNEYLFGEPVLIHSNAILLKKKLFATKESFQAFHEGISKNVFVDISEEMKAQQEEIAAIIAEEMQKEKGLSLVEEVFEEILIRREYVERLKEILKISEKRAGKILQLMRKKYRQ